MGSRMLPIDCERCGGVFDWGHFGLDQDDGQVGRTCECEPELVVWLRAQIEETTSSDMALAYERVVDHLIDDADYASELSDG